MQKYLRRLNCDTSCGRLEYVLIIASVATDICGSATHVKTNNGLLCVIVPRGHSVAHDPSSWATQNCARTIESEGLFFQKKLLWYFCCLQFHRCQTTVTLHEQDIDILQIIFKS